MMSSVFAPATPCVVCPKCKRQIGRIVQLARTSPDVEFMAACHGATKRFRFAYPISGDLAEWYAQAVARIEEAFRPLPAFRIRTRPHGRRSTTSAP